MNDLKSKNLFTVKPIAMLLAASCVVAWAFAFPLIKLGLTAFEIANDDTGAKTLFAGIRFSIAGIFVLIAALLSKKDVRIKGAGNIGVVVLFGLVNTSLHYYFYYIGLSYQTGSRSAIIDSTSTFLLIILACVFFAEEKFTFRKVIGCLLGFGGIMLVNLGGDMTARFTLMGDGMLVLSAVSSAFGGLLTRVASKRMDTLVATAISLVLGGLVLVGFGVAMGGRITVISVKGALILAALVAISVYGFSVYNQLLSCNPVGEIAIFNAFIPIMGVILSCAILGETFMLKYIVAGFVVAAGVFTINFKSGE